MAIVINGSANTIAGLSAGGISNANAIAKAAMPAGSVLQVIQVQKKDAWTGDNDSSYEAISGLSASITPLSTSNKVLVEAIVWGGVDKGRWAGIRLYRGGSVVSDAISTAYSGSHYNTIDGQRQNRNWISFGYSPDDTHEENRLQLSSGKYLDSPSSTSSLTYDLRIIGRESTTNYFINYPQYGHGSDSSVTAVSSITLTEIAG